MMPQKAIKRLIFALSAIISKFPLKEITGYLLYHSFVLRKFGIDRAKSDGLERPGEGETGTCPWVIWADGGRVVGR
jgi:hypothetical protein